MPTVRCTQSSCTGTVEDGYCDVCGHAPEKRSEALVQGGASRHSGGSHSVITGTGSSPMSRASKGSRRSRRSSSRTSRRQLGAGLITLPELPSADPEKTVLVDPVIPQHKRFCSNCDAPLKRDFGYCGKCGQKFSFVPSLHSGDLVAGQYEVKGALAFGGLGWIYLAFDLVLSRYVVLKGLLNVHDASSAAAAVAERQFLASVKHPNIVGIYNFVQHGAEGFIVMEYVGGKSLKQLRQERGPLPPAEAVAYIHRILSAFAYLHDKGLVYCDFKPDNVMLECDDVKLIDMGGVRRIDDTKGDIYCTAGYGAPESAEGPTQASDLFTVGRTLAVLLADFRGLTTDYRYTLPSPADVPVFAQQESLYRFLLKATALNPDDRFADADEMAEQLLGVLREIVAVSTGQPRPAASVLFGMDPLVFESGEEMRPVRAEARYVPAPLIDTADSGARAASAALQLTNPKKRVEALQQACEQAPKSRETKLRLAMAHGETKNWLAADKVLDELAANDPWDWRVLWIRGRLQLERDEAAEAQKNFDQVYFDLPGETAPKLALAIAAERAGKPELARRMYELVSQVDDGYPSSSFGLARCAGMAGERSVAAQSLNRIPQNSSVWVRARVQAVDQLISHEKTLPTPDDLVAAASTAEHLPLDMLHAGELRSRVLQMALELVVSRQMKSNKKQMLFGARMQENDLRLALERTFRAMAQLVSADQRVQLVDRANQVRPRTLV